MLRSAMRRFGPALVGILLVLAPSASAGQIMFPVDSVESWLGHQNLEVGTQTGARFEGDRTQRTMVTLDNGQTMLVKWAKAPRGGEEFNNVPRYELAAYELQKLFLDVDEYVVPPIVLRSFPLQWYRERVSRTAGPTFDDARSSVLVALHYWLFDVEPITEIDEDRLEEDPAYARACANLNILTHLIDHKDANEGNFLISRSEQNPRLFSVDNGVAFGSDPSDRGDKWRHMQVKRLPRSTVERLRSISREDLDRALGVLAQWEVRDGRLVRVEPTENFRENRGIRKRDGSIQVGLTSREIGNVEDRLDSLLRKVVSGDYALF